LFCSLFLSLAVARGRGEHQSANLSGNVGDKVSFDIKPQTQISGIALWTFGPDKAVIVRIVQTKLLFIKSERYQVNLTTGSLTINDLTLNDDGAYGFQVHNGRKSEYKFILKVVGE